MRLENVGEKGHCEYGWSAVLQDRIVQFTFQTTRTTDPLIIESLSFVLQKLIVDLISSYRFQYISTGMYTELMTTLYKTIGHTRDVIEGKGEYSHAYMQILVWYEFFPALAMYALEKCVLMDDNDTDAPNKQHPYGSWKDIKYFCHYVCKVRHRFQDHPIVQFAFSLINSQLFMDSVRNEKSLAAKWVPREKCNKFGWMFDPLAYGYFKHYLNTPTTIEARLRAQKKCKMDYRKLCNGINHHLETTQIYQCSNRWDKIDPSTVTSITWNKQKQALLNVRWDGSQRTEKYDRVQCAETFKSFIRVKPQIKGQHMGLNQFTVEAFDLICRKRTTKHPETVQLEIDLLNAQWRDHGRRHNPECLRNMVAMVDSSDSMEWDGALYTAFGLGCRVAESSILGKRVLSFSHNPTWHNLDACPHFVDMIEELQRGEIGYSANIYKAFQMMLDAVVEQKWTPEDVAGLTLAIFSDMQVDVAQMPDPTEDASRHDTTHTHNTTHDTTHDTLFKGIEWLYSQTGMRLHGKPFPTPHLLFWNLRSTNGFPCLSNEKNVTMVSGFSPALLNLFCEKGLSGINHYNYSLLYNKPRAPPRVQLPKNPWTELKEMLNKERYKCLEDKIKGVL